MDSLTQAALGATVAYAVAGKSLGRKAVIAGAVLGTLPDLDVLVPYADAIDNFTYHRSWSHSYLTLTLASPLLAWLLQAIFRRSHLPFSRYFLMVWLVFVTHPLLDSFTVYGTQVWWPIPTEPIAWGTIFIIDPLFTLPLLVASLWVIFRRSRENRSPGGLADHSTEHTTLVRSALCLSLVYLSLTVFLKLQVERETRESLVENGFNAQRFAALPTPGSLLWRIVARDEEEYVEGFYSLLRRNRSMAFDHYPVNEKLLEKLGEEPAVRRFIWFTKGFYATDIVAERVVISDLRMGVEAQYVFRFEIAEVDPNSLGSHENATFRPLRPTRLLRFQPDLERIKWVLQQY